MDPFNVHIFLEPQNDAPKTAKDKIASKDGIEKSQDSNNKTEPQEVKSPDKGKIISAPEPANSEQKIEDQQTPEKNEEQIPSKTEEIDEASGETNAESKDVAETPDENGEHVGESDADQQSEEPPKKAENKNVERNGKRKRHDDSFEESRSSKKPRERHHEQVEIKEDEPDMNYEKVQISWCELYCNVN